MEKKTGMSAADLHLEDNKGEPQTALPSAEHSAASITSKTNGHTDGQNGARPELAIVAVEAPDGLESTIISVPEPATDPVLPATKPKSQSQKSPRPTVEGLIKVVQTYNPTANVEGLKKAYVFAEEAHEGQFRNSGEPYITHPLNVAIILAEMRLDIETLQAALLHDVIEDTPVTFEDVKDKFGPVVAHLVEGVTKLGAIPNLRGQQTAGGDGRADDEQRQEDKRRQEEKRQREAQQAENLRKMFLAMFDDPRVVLIKLADRLHNMRTLDAIKPEKQHRIAAQTLEIYAPLANRLGMWRMKGELEDIAFSYLNPERYDELANMLKETKTARDRYLKRVINLLGAETARGRDRAHHQRARQAYLFALPEDGAEAPPRGAYLRFPGRAYHRGQRKRLLRGSRRDPFTVAAYLGRVR